MLWRLWTRSAWHLHRSCRWVVMKETCSFRGDSGASATWRTFSFWSPPTLSSISLMAPVTLSFLRRLAGGFPRQRGSSPVYPCGQRRAGHLWASVMCLLKDGARCPKQSRSCFYEDVFTPRVLSQLRAGSAAPSLRRVPSRVHREHVTPWSPGCQRSDCE